MNPLPPWLLISRILLDLDSLSQESPIFHGPPFPSHSRSFPSPSLVMCHSSFLLSVYFYFMFAHHFLHSLPPLDCLPGPDLLSLSNLPLLGLEAYFFFAYFFSI